MASAAEHPYRATLDGLARTLRSLRGERAPTETARRLLEYDNPGHAHLVGLRWDARRAVFCHCGDRYAIALRFSADGLADGGVEVAAFEAAADVRRWVAATPSYWSWRHPRYR